MARNTWLSNFGKSVKFGAIEAAEDLNPAITKLRKDNQEFFSNISQTLSDIHRGQTTIGKALSESSPELGKTLDAISQVGQRTADDLKHFLKTGDMMGGRRRETGGATGGSGGSGGGDVNLSDFNLGDDEFDFSDLPSPEEAMGAVKSADTASASVAASVGAAQIEASNKNTQATLAASRNTAAAIANVASGIKAQTGLTAKGIEANAKLVAQSSAAMITAFQSVGTQMSSQLTMINDNLANLVNFNNDTHVKYTMAALSYFDQSLEQLKLIASAAGRLAPEDRNNENQTDYERVFGNGGFDVASYMNTLKSNIQKTELGPLVGFLENPEMLVEALENPIQTVTTQLIKSAVPAVMKGAMDELNKSMEYFFPALLGKLAGLGNDPNQNIFVQTIGKLFGVEAPSARPNLGAYNKGAVPFDGITHKTINQVIPTYLSKILATLTGGEERMFNHDTGTFETLSDIRARHKMADEAMRDSALGSFGHRLTESKKNLVFEDENEARIFKEAIEGFKDAMVNSGQFVNFNNEDQMADLMRRVQVEGMTEAMRGAMQDWIAYNARMMPKHEQMRASTAAYEYALQKQRNMKMGASNGDYSTWYANSNFTDQDSAADAARANRLLGDGGYKPSAGGPGGPGSSKRFVGPYIRDQEELKKRILSNKENPNYGKEVGSGKASFDDLMAGGAKFAMDIQRDYLDNLKKKSAADIKGAKKPGDLGLRSMEDELDDGYFPEEAKARRRARMSTMDKLKDAAYTKPADILASSINAVNETLYRMIFGAGPDEESIIQILANNINSVFTKVKDWIMNDIYHPFKRFLFGDDFKKTNFYQFFAGLFKRGSDVMRGEQDGNGNWKGGMASEVMNEFNDAGRAIRNVITGKGYKDSHGVDHPENKDSVLGNMKTAFTSIFSTVKKYLMGGKDQGEQDAWKKQFIEDLEASKFVRVKNKILDTVNKAAGGRIGSSGTYILSKGEKVISRRPLKRGSAYDIAGHLASGTVGETGAYELNAGDTVVPNKDISKSRLEEGNFFAGILQRTYGRVTDKLDQVIDAIHGTTKAVEDGGGVGAGGDRAATIARINQLVGDINANRGIQTKKTPFIDVVFNKVAKSLSQFAGLLGGSKNFDNKYIQKEYAQAIRKKAPKAIAHGAIAGAGLGLASLAGAGGTFGSFGLLSFFLPGGFIGSALLGLGLGILHQNEAFMTMMYGKKGKDGIREGGMVPKKVQDFLKKNKTGLLGGAVMGGIYGLTGFSIPGMALSAVGLGGAGGLVSTLGVGLMGPVLFGSAMGLALKSQGMQRFLFGTGNEKDGKKAKGVLNGKVADKVKQFLPNAAVGSGLGYLAGSIMDFGVLGAFVSPYATAMVGGAIGLGMASEKFKETLFGKYDEKKKQFVSGGLVDTMKEAIKLEVLKPLSVFGQKSLAKMEHFIATDIVYPIAKAVMPLRVVGAKIVTSLGNMLKDTITGVGKGISSVFSTILAPIKWLAKKAWDWTWGASKSLLNGIFSVAGTVISLPFKALGMTGSMITMYEKMTGGTYKEDLKDAARRAEDYRKRHEEDFKDRMKELDEDEKQYKFARKEARKSGYALNKEQLQEKTDQYHEELRYAEEQRREAERVAAERRKTAEVQREELKELLRQANMKLEGFSEDGKAILTTRRGKKERITDDSGNLMPVMSDAAIAQTTKSGVSPISAGRKRAIEKGIAARATGTATPATVKATEAGAVNALARSVDKLATNVGVENTGIVPPAEEETSGGGNVSGITAIKSTKPHYTPRGQMASISRASGAHHAPASISAPGNIPVMKVPGVANQLQAAGIQRQDRMYDLVSQFYAMVEYKFDDMLGYNDIQASKNDSGVGRGMAIAGGQLLFNQFIAPAVLEMLAGKIGGISGWLGNKSRKFFYGASENDTSGIRGKLGQMMGLNTRNQIEEANISAGYQKDMPKNIALIEHTTDIIDEYLTTQQINRLDTMISLLSDIKSNTESSTPITGHSAAGGLIRKTGAYILSAGERGVRGAGRALSNIAADATSEGSFFAGMKSKGNAAINQGMQAVASAIGSLKGLLKEIADHGKDQIDVLKEFGSHLRDTVSWIYNNPGAALSNTKDFISRGASRAKAAGVSFYDSLGAALGTAKDKAGEVLRDADSKVSGVFGGRTAEVILKEREEAQYRQDVLDALRNQGVEQIKQDPEPWWKKLFGFLPWIVKAIGTFLAPLGAIGVIVKNIYDWFTGGHGGYGNGANGSIAGMENATREVAYAGARAAARAAGRFARSAAGRTIGRAAGFVGRKAAEGARGIANGMKYGEAAIEEARFTNNDRFKLKDEHTKLTQEISELEAKGTAMTREEAALLESKRADRTVIEEAIEREGRKVDRLLAQSTATNALEAGGKSLGTMADAAEAEGKTAKAKLLKGLEKLMTSAGGAVEKVANTKIAGKVLEWLGGIIRRVGKIPGAGIAKAALKLTGKGAMAMFGMVPGIGWLVNGAWAGIEGVLGWMDAAELLGVNPENCTVGMKVAVSVTNALMSLPYIMWLDVAIQLLDGIAGTAVKRYILTNVYKVVAPAFDENGEEIEGLQQKNQEEFSAYYNEEVKRLMEEENMDEKSAKEQANQTHSYREFMKMKDDNYNPVKDWIRDKTGVVGETLLGKNDENGHYQKGLFAQGKDALDSGLAYLFGQNDAEGNYQKGLFARGKDALSNELAYFLGDYDENGEYKNNMVADVKAKVAEARQAISDRIDNELAWIFGEEGKQSGLGQSIWGKGIDLMSWILGANREDVENMMNETSDSVAAKIESAKKAIGNEVEYVTNTAKEKYNELTGAISQGIDNAKAKFDSVYNALADDIEQNVAPKIRNELAWIFGQEGQESVFAKAGNMLSERVDSATDELGRMYDSATDKIGKALDDFFENTVVGRILSDAGKAISGFVGTIGNGLLTAGNTVVDKLAGLGNYIWTGITGTIDGAVEAIGDAWSAGVDALLGTGTKYQDRRGATARRQNVQQFQNTAMNSFAGQGGGDYSQFDPRWAGSRYGESSYAGGGCGPTVMASILARMGKKVNPYELGTAAAGAGYKSRRGTNEMFLPDVASMFGVRSTKLGSMGEAIDSVRSGKEVVLGGMSGSGAGAYTRAGHYTRLAGIDGGSALLADPRGFTSKIGLGELAKDTRTAYAFEGSGFGDNPYPDYSRLGSSNDGMFNDFVGATKQWLLDGGPLSTIIWAVKQDVQNMQMIYNDYLKAPIEGFAGVIKDTFSNVADQYISFGKMVYGHITKEGIVHGGFSIMREMFGGLFGADIPTDIFRDIIGRVADMAKFGFGKVTDFFKGIGDKFNTVLQTLNKWKPTGLLGSALGKVIDFAIGEAPAGLKKVVSLVQDWWKESGAKSFGLSGAGIDTKPIKNITPATDRPNEKDERLAFLNYMVGVGGGGINFDQADKDWGGKDLFSGISEYGKMKDIGCAPTGLATALANAGTLVTPKDTMKLIGSSDIAKTGNRGVLPKFFPKAMRAMGGEFFAINPNDKESVKKAIAAGASMVAGGKSTSNDGSSLFTTAGHYANIKGGFRKGGTDYVIANDPLNRGRSVYRLDDVMKDIQSGGPNMIGIVSPNKAVPNGVKAVPMSSTLFGGSGDYGEDEVWARQHSGVSTERAKTQTMEALQDLGTWFKGKTGHMLTLTSCTDGHSHNQGEFSHYNGWKLDVNDWGNGLSGGYLVTNDDGVGSLGPAFEEYGRSKGLGMNFENDHYDVAVNGTEWTTGNDYGGWKGGATINKAKENASTAIKPRFVGTALCNTHDKRKVTLGVILHHFGDENNIDRDASASEIHTMHKNNGWEGIGYHYVIRKGGTIERGREEECVGAHALHEDGFPSKLCNQNSIGINIAGTFNGTNQPTAQQLKSAAELIAYLSKKYGFPIDKTHVIGHRDTMATNCPGDNLYAKIDSIIAEAKKLEVSTNVENSAGPDKATGKPAGFLDQLSHLFTTVAGDYAQALWSGKAYTGSDINSIFNSGNSSSNPASSGSVTSAITTGKNTEDAWNYFKKVGFSDAEVAGILGNFQQESNMEPKKLQGGRILDEMDDIHSERGYGLAQWTDWSRKQKLKDYAASTGRSTGDMATQLEFAWKEAQKSGVVEAMHAASQDPDTQAKIWMDIFERPGTPELSNRQKYARDFFNTYAGKSGSGFGTSLASYMNSGLYGGGGLGSRILPKYTGNVMYMSKAGAGGTILPYISKRGKAGSGWLATPIKWAVRNIMPDALVNWLISVTDDYPALQSVLQGIDIADPIGLAQFCADNYEQLDEDAKRDAFSTMRMLEANYGYGGGGGKFGQMISKAFWGSSLGGLAHTLGFKSPEDKAKALAAKRALEAKQKASTAEAKKPLTAQDIVKKLSIKETDFDEFGNLKLYEGEPNILNNGTQDDQTKYHNQYLQLQHYLKAQAEKAKLAEKKEEFKPSQSTTRMSGYYGATSPTIGTTASSQSQTIQGSKQSAIDTAISSSAAQTEFISELRSLDIHQEANLMVKYLEIIAKNQYELAKGLKSGGVVGGSAAGGAVGAAGGMNPTKPPTLPANHSNDRKTNVSGKKDYGAIHSKNVEIARGGSFKDS